MFEGLVSDLLNRILGTYIENLDSSKLKISIWGGDVELKGLVIKQSALDELNLPLRPIYGYLNRLCLKIPWNKLYTERWEAAVEGLMLVVVPNTSIKYDPIKEEQLQHEAKLSSLNDIERAKQKNQQKASDDKKNEDGFLEKLVAQIIRNIQVQIKSIHIRYEDCISCPSNPFACGVVLRNLSLQSTDANWEIGLDRAKLIYKLLSLEGFVVFWSPNTTLLSQCNMSKDDLLNTLSATSVSSMESDFESLKPILGPVNLTAKLQMNTRPEFDDIPYSVPKAILDVVLESLSIGISRHQYAGMINLLDSVDRMNRSSKFRKYRPHVSSISGYSRLWWQYAYNCILDDINRIALNWSWSYIKKHRETCQLYRSIYKKKLMSGKLNEEETKALENYEKSLDVFNITLVRRQAEMEQEREGLLMKNKPKSKGWFGGWFSWGQEEAAEGITASNIVQQFEAAMDSEEKKKLCEAIGYSEVGIPKETPISYVDVKLKFLLEELLLNIFDDLHGKETVCIFSLAKVACSVDQRSAGDAVRAEASIQSLNVKGLTDSNNVQPNLVESLNVSNDLPLLYIMAETNPIDKECDTRVKVSAQPLNITYHSATVTHAVSLFTPPKDISLQQLQATALTRLAVVKEKSVTGMQAAIDSHSILDLNINIKSSRLILPEKGNYDPHLSMIVMMLGSISIMSKPRDKNAMNLIQLSSSSSTKEAVLEKMRCSTYDSFSLHLEDMQVVVAGRGEEWMSALVSHDESPLHLLRPVSLSIDILKCLIMTDPNLPKIKIIGTLPEISLTFRDTKIIEAAVIVNNCFSNQSATYSHDDEFKEEMDLNQNIVTDEIALLRLENSELATSDEYQPTLQFTEVMVNFTIGAIVVEMLTTQSDDTALNLLKVAARETALLMVKRTYNFTVELTLSQIEIDHLQYGLDPILRTYSEMGSDEVLLSLKYCQVNPKSPDIHIIHSSVTEKIEADLSGVTVHLEQKALLSLLSFSNKIQAALSQLDSSTEQEIKNDKERNKVQEKEENSLSEKITRNKELHKKYPFEKKIVAKMGQIHLSISRGEDDLVALKIKGLSVDISMKQQEMQILSHLQEFILYDPNPDIIVMEGSHAWDARIYIFQESKDETDVFNVDKYDTAIHLEIGTPQIVFLNKIVVDVLSWVNNFQAAKEALASASQAAAEAAKSNLREAYSSYSKVKLDLMLKAPIIFVPHSTQSREGIVLDLGKIQITNKFEFGSVFNELGHPSLFDKIRLSIQDVKVSRKRNFSDVEELSMLAPFSFTLGISRNLSISWHKLVPEIEVTGRLKAIEVTLNDSDISSVFAILNGNLAATTDESVLSSSTVPEVEAVSFKKPLAAVSVRERDQKLAESGILFRKMTLKFTLDAISLSLFTADEQKTPESDESLSQHFAKLSLDGLTVKLDLFSDGTVGANLLLYDCVLQDTRKGREAGITRMMEKKPLAYEKKIPVIDVTYHQNFEKDTFVDVKICEFLLIMHLPFLLRLQRFITTEIPQDMNLKEEEDEECEPVHLAFLVSSQTLEGSTSKTNKTTTLSVKRKKPVVEKNEAVMTVRLKIEQPDIVLIEDLDSMDTSCIIMHSEIQSSIKMSESQRNITASISKIQLYTCCYNPVKRLDTLSQILKPSEITMVCSSTSTHADNIQISVGTLKFRLAADTVELFMSIMGSISSPEEKAVKPTNEIRNWSGLWNPKDIDFDALPHLKIERAEEAISSGVVPMIHQPIHASKKASLGGEALHLEIMSILVTLEAGSGSSAIPLLQLQSDCQVIAGGFYSSQLTFNGHLSLELAYYNPRQAIWEPLLEPVEKTKEDGTTDYQSWSLSFEGTMDLDVAEAKRRPSIPSGMGSNMSSPISDFGDSIELETIPPKLKINVSAKDPLEFTVTKTFLDVLNVLSNSFVEACKGELSIRHTPSAPYKLYNKTGLLISVELKESGLKLSKSSDSVEECLVEPNGEVYLFDCSSDRVGHRRHSSLVAECQVTIDKCILIKIPEIDSVCSIPVTKADKHYFPLSAKGKSTEKLGIVTSVIVEEGCKAITLSSCVMIKNELDTDVDVYYMTENGNSVEFVTRLEPQKDFFLPFWAVYTPSSEIYFSVKGYSICINPLVWKRLQNYPSLIQELCCQPRKKNDGTHSTPFLFCANCEVEQVFWGNTSRHTLNSIMITVNLRACIILNNFLPVAISVTPPGVNETKVMLPGTNFHITHGRMGSIYLEIEILYYRKHDWKCGKTIEVNPPELSVWTFTLMAFESEVTLDLGMHIINSRGTFYLSLYCPFWMVNKSDLNLTYKTDTLTHSILHKRDSKEVVLFSFRSKAFFGKKKANIQVDNGEWSEKFPLDTVGSSGAITCKTDGVNRKISVDIHLAASGLTKIVTFSPFYKAVNHCPYDLEFSYPDDPCCYWYKIKAGECLGIWPPGLNKAITVRMVGYKEKTNPIHFDAPHTTLFKIKNKFGGVFVEVTMSEGGTVISLDKCLEGATSALVLNYLSRSSLVLWQEDQEDKKIELGPRRMIHFTWDSALSRRLILFTCMGCDPVKVALNSDNRGTIGDGTAGWATWIGCSQRYIVVSEDFTLLENPLQASEVQRVDNEIEVSFSSIGLSLVNDVKSKEVLYLCMASSGVVWEHRKEKGKKFRPFSVANTELLEKVYLIHLAQSKTLEGAQYHFNITPNLEVDFALMQVFKPFKRFIRRVFQPGIWMQLQLLPSQRNLHVKVNKIQLDNQMQGVMFPVVLARVPPPKGVMAETVPKPFFELSVVMSMESQLFAQFKYFQMLIQEFHVKVELPFIFAIIETVFPDQRVDVIYSPEKYEKDASVIQQDLTALVAGQKQPSRRDFYNNLHLSPIKMHLSFSLTGLESSSNVPIGGQVVYLFLQSVGVTLTEVQDVVFKLGFFERQNCWLNIEGLQNEALSHYQNQIMKQLYILVLGLDVLGNPFGLVLGVTKGFGDLFYEPIQGAIEGPGEFAEGLFYGARSFMGKTVGGAAGAFSRITGTIGKGVATLTLDEDYQRRRREEMHNKPSDGLETFARGGKGLVAGVFDGVTGVILKPISGAQEEGVEGFFKGVGKGMVGLVTRPASGVIDFAAGSFNAVMRATDSSEEAAPVRESRFIAKDGIIRPYDYRSSMGCKLLRELEKGRYLDTDSYVVHTLVKGGKSVLLGTDRRIILMFKNDLLGNWKIEWVHTYDEFAEPPLLVSSVIYLTVKIAKKKVLGFFGGGDNSKEIDLHDPNDAKFVVDRLVGAYNNYIKSAVN